MYENVPAPTPAVPASSARPEAGDIRVEVLGRARALVDGREVPLTPADRALLTAVAVLPQLSPDRELAELAWGPGGYSPRAFSSSIYRLRKALGTASFTKARGAFGFTDRVRLDLDEFRECLVLADLDPDDTTSLEQALALVRGRPFDSSHSELFVPVRASWEQQVVDVAAMLTARLLRLHQHGRAESMARLVVTRFPHVERAWVCLVEVQAASGQRDRAGRTLRDGVASLARAGNRSALELLDTAARIGLASPVSRPLPGVAGGRAVDDVLTEIAGTLQRLADLAAHLVRSSDTERVA